MAYKMQTSVPEMTDFSKEPAKVLEMYGPDVKRQGSFAYNCLMARRLVERGTRFVQLFHAGWDQHRNLNTQLKVQCEDTDAPSAALVKDRSEEHTSELQSLRHLVCRLLLEKKKKTRNTQTTL